MVAAELFLNSEDYSQHEHLAKASQHPDIVSNHADTLFSILLSSQAQGVFDETRDRSSAIEEEAKYVCSQYNWSSMIQLMALSSVIQHPIQSVYPDANKGIRPLIHTIITPVKMITHKQNIPVLSIMWTRDGNLDNRDGALFQPNHFVPVISRKVLNTVSNQFQTVNQDPLPIRKPKHNFLSSSPVHEWGEQSYCEASTTEMNMEEGTNIDNDINLDQHVNQSDILCQNNVDIGEISNPHQLHYKEKCHILKQHFRPDINYQGYITQTVTKGKAKLTKTLTFQYSWLQKYPWLVYSPSQNGAFCKYCCLFPPKDLRVNKTGVLVSKPFTNLAKACGKDGILEKHHELPYHRDSISRAKMALDALEKPEISLRYLINKQNTEAYDKNIHILKSVTKAIILCGKQAIPLRGHKDDSTSTDSNKGNFLAVLNLMAEGDSVLKEHLDYGKKNAKYTSKTVQNELIVIIGNYIRSQIAKSLSEADAVFSIIADEVTDRYANQEIMSLCLRFIEEDPHPEIKEIFYDFIHLQRTTGEEIAKQILCNLKNNNLDVHKVRGQSYDGASAMSSENVGVQGRIKRVEPKALYTHCKSHVLNLSIGASCKLPPVRNMIDNINESYLFFHNSPKRQRYFENVIANYSETAKVIKLQGLCKTRWTERHTCFEVFYEMYGILCTTLEFITDPTAHRENNDDWNWDRETRTKAQGLLSSLHASTNIISFVVVKNILDTVKGLASKLQKRDQDICQAYAMIDESKGKVQYIRDNIDSEFHQIFLECEELADKLNVEITKPRVAGRQTQRGNAPSESVEEHFKRNIALPFLDFLNSEMSKRFNLEDRVGAALFKLLPNNIGKLTENADIDSLAKDLQFWQTDLESPSSLRNEIKWWKIKWQKHSDKVPENLVECLQEVDVDEFPNIRKLLIVGCTLPISSCEAERSFSTLRRTKTFLRSTMAEERLAGLSLMAIHHSLHIDLDLIVNTFVTKNPRRLFGSSVIFD